MKEREEEKEERSIAARRVIATLVLRVARVGSGKLETEVSTLVLFLSGKERLGTRRMNVHSLVVCRLGRCTL